MAGIQAWFCPQFAVPLCHQSSFCELSSACQTFYTVCEKIAKFSHRRGKHGRALLRATVEVTFDYTTSWEAFADQVCICATCCYEDDGLALQNDEGLHLLRLYIKVQVHNFFFRATMAQASGNLALRC